MDTENR